MRLSLRLKMILAFSLVVIVAVAGIVLFANLDSERQVRTYMERGGQYGLTRLVEALEDRYSSVGSWEGIDSIFTTTSFRSGKGNPHGAGTNLTLLDAERRVVWSSAGEPSGKILDKATIENAIRLVNSDKQNIGFLLVANQSALGVNDISPFINRLKSVILYSGIAAVILAIALAVLVSNTLLRPVKALTRASAELSSGNLSERVKVDGNDELADLAKTFNQMAASLEGAEERKKTLTADVAHELRTPIAVQKAQLEGMLDGVLPVDEENLTTALQQVDFLSRMVDDLRLLAMADAGEVEFNYRETDLEQLINQLVNAFQGHAQQAGVQIVSQFETHHMPLVVHTDPDRLTQIMNNLLSNAMRYGKKGGIIKIFGWSDRNNAAISVVDDGEGIPETAIPHLFERFYRHDQARSRETGGTGLGLAISKKLALLMGGDLTGGNTPGGGAIFTVTIIDHN